MPRFQVDPQFPWRILDTQGDICLSVLESAMVRPLKEVATEVCGLLNAGWAVSQPQINLTVKTADILDVANLDGFVAGTTRLAADMAKPEMMTSHDGYPDDERHDTAAQ